MNKLYGLIVSAPDVAAPEPGYYLKKYYPVRHTLKSIQMREDLLATVPDERTTLFACFMCNAVLETVFGEEISRLDRENTYCAFTRDPDKTGDDSDLAIWDVTRPAEALRPVYKWLDQDIKDRLVVPGWLDIMAALCLQMLRETVDA